MLTRGKPNVKSRAQNANICGAPWSRRFACHAGIPTGIPKNVGTDADVAT
jgi:hypothetical protein